MFRPKIDHLSGAVVLPLLAGILFSVAIGSADWFENDDATITGGLFSYCEHTVVEDCKRGLCLPCLLPVPT